MAHGHANDDQPRRGHPWGPARDDYDVLDQEFPRKAETRWRRHPRTSEGLDQRVAGPYAWITTARSAGNDGRSALVHGPNEQRARPARSQDRPFQRISAQERPFRTTWTRRGHTRKHLVHGQHRSL